MEFGFELNLGISQPSYKGIEELGFAPVRKLSHGLPYRLGAERETRFNVGLILVVAIGDSDRETASGPGQTAEKLRIQARRSGQREGKNP